MASPPAQLTQNQWDEVVSNSGTIDYEKLGGDGGKTTGNCNTTSSDIIENAGGKIPFFDPPGLNPGLRTGPSPLKKSLRKSSFLVGPFGFTGF